MAPASSVTSTGTDETADARTAKAVTTSKSNVRSGSSLGISIVARRVTRPGQTIAVKVRNVALRGGSVRITESVAPGSAAAVTVAAHRGDATFTLHPSRRLMQLAGERRERIKVVSTVVSGDETKRATALLSIGHQ